jgi:asparagine synthase (glutamine-hydrolysing)
MHYMDDPIGDFSIFPTFLVSQLAKESVTVSLSGDGGDELFAGYESYVAQKMANTYRLIPAPVRRLIGSVTHSLRPSEKKKGLTNKIKRFVEGSMYPESLGHARWRIFMSDALRASLFTPEFSRECTELPGHHIDSLYKRSAGRTEIDSALYVDAKSYLPDNCLVKVDRMSMAVSLEVRVPFLDLDMVSLAFSMPDEMKLNGTKTKYLLKKFAATRIPRDCVYRAKEGFSIPIKNWLSGQFRPILDEYTERSDLAAEGLFDPGMIARLKQEHLDGIANHSHILWSLIVFQAWRRKWLEG